VSSSRATNRYNEFFLEYILNAFSVAEALELLEANEVQRPVTLRTNTLKVRAGEPPPPAHRAHCAHRCAACVSPPPAALPRAPCLPDVRLAPRARVATRRRVAASWLLRSSTAA
jgi:hypothetical protein